MDIDKHATIVHYEETVLYFESILRCFSGDGTRPGAGGWAGLYDVTPDWQPVIDRIEEVEEFYCAVGPAVGTIVAELVTEGTCRTYDINTFRRRLREGKLNETAYAYSIIG